MLDGISAIFNIGLLCLFSFFLGYLILLLIKPKRLLNLPFFVRLPIYLTLGLLTLTILLFITSLVRINGYTLIAITLLSLPPIFYYRLKSKSEKETETDFISLDNIVPAALFIITFLYFSNAIAIFEWPPPGDVFNHGLFTSILVSNRKTSFTMGQYAPSLPLPPLLSLSGLHVLSATLSMFTGVFPGEAVFIVGGTIVILIPMLLYSLTYILTRSKLLSLLTFLSTFLIGIGLEEWVFGYFYNGPYPNLFGFLAILLFLTYPIASSEIQVERKQSTHETALTLLIILGVLLVYPVFVIFILLYFLVSALYEEKVITTFKDIVKKRKNVFLLLLFSTTILLFVALSITTNQELFQVLQGMTLHLSKVYGRLGYAIYTPIFYTSTIGVTILIAGIVSILFAIKHFYSKLALFYLVVFVPVMLSLHPDLFPLFSYILPNRSLMICSLVSWVILAVLLCQVFADSRHVSKRIAFKNRSYITQTNPNKIIAVFLIVSLVFTPSLFSTLTFEPAHRYSWLMRHGFANDYDVLLWVNENVRPADLIMNDYSYTSRYLLSFSIKNVTAKHYFNSDFERTRALDVEEFWKKPMDIARFLNLIEKYNISYVLITSELGCRIPKDIGGSSKYIAKPYSPAMYKALFDDSPLLELMFEKGNASIYKISIQGEVESMNALEFDGINDYTKVEHDESITLSTEFTMALWFKPYELPDEDSFLISKINGYDGYELGWRWNNRVAIYLNGRICLQSNKVFKSEDLSKWWHIVILYDGLQAYIYINGNIDSCSDAPENIALNTTPLGIGCRKPDKPFGFAPNHILDDVCIWNRALSSSEIEQLYKGESVKNGLVLFLPFDESEGTIAYDKSDYDNTGTIYGAKWVKYYALHIDSLLYRM